MTPEQREARRRIDAIYGDQSHPYWHGDRDATREMEGYFQTLNPEPAESPRGATDALGASAAAPDQGLGQTAEQRAARQRIDAIYGDQSHPYWHGDRDATREMEGYFKALNPEPAESPMQRVSDVRVPVPPGGQAQSPAPGASSTSTTSKPQRRSKGIGYYLGPDAMAGLRNIGRIGGAALELFSPGADIRDMVRSSQASADAFGRGDIGKGLVEAAYATVAPLGILLPGSVSGYRKVGEELGERVVSEFSRRAGYNPQPLPQRPFHDDYPEIPESSDGGRLTQSIDGEPLTAPVVAGRRSVQGGDEALTQSEFDRAYGQLVDRTEVKKRLGKDVGRTFKEADDDGNFRRVVQVLKGLSPDEQYRVLRHEFAHIVDSVAGKIETNGIKRELEQVYHDLATGQQGQPRHRTRPQDLGYSSEAVPRELMAEAIRAYMVDPNYLKTVAPKTAARIRQYVNTNYRLKHVIQFNSIGGAFLAGAGAAGAPVMFEGNAPSDSER